jgi:hypothetical protein
VQNLLQQIKKRTDLMLLVCPKEIAGNNVDDKFFRSSHKKEKESDASSKDSPTVFERMLKADWEKLEIPKEAELISLKVFNVTYNIYCYRNKALI